MRRIPNESANLFEGYSCAAIFVNNFPSREARILMTQSPGVQSPGARIPGARRAADPDHDSRNHDSLVHVAHVLGGLRRKIQAATRALVIRASAIHLPASLAGTISVRLRDTSLLCFRANRSPSTAIALDQRFRR